MTYIFKKLLLVILIAAGISSCSAKKDNFEIDISKLNLPKNVLEPVINDSEIKPEKESITYKLKTLKSKNEVMDNIKYGREDPFSNTGIDSKKLIANFQLKGFISTKDNNYALVIYKEEEGFISINSIGGVNTKLIPDKALVKEISPKKEEIIISIKDDRYNIKLGEK